MAPRFDVPEGASPIEDASGLIPPGVITYGDLCAVEAENILHAANKHLKRRKNSKRTWLTDEYLREVHRDMFGAVWEWAGHYRESEYNIGVPPHRIAEEIRKLCHDAVFWNSQKENSISVLERAVRIHHRLAWIHPFPNGNGRHARMMADILLHSHRHSIPSWPSSNTPKLSNPRERYLAALRKADHGDFNSLIEYTASLLQP